MSCLSPRLTPHQAQSICFKIQCDQYLQTAAKDATGERAAGLQALASTLTGQGITVSNIVDYMSLIEQRSIQVRDTPPITTGRKISAPMLIPSR